MLENLDKVMASRFALGTVLLFFCVMLFRIDAINRRKFDSLAERMEHLAERGIIAIERANQNDEKINAVLQTLAKSIDRQTYMLRGLPCSFPQNKGRLHADK